MNRYILSLILILITVKLYSQETRVNVSGGYAWANIKDSDKKATGWRINGSYEINPLNSRFSHGVSAGYISLNLQEGELKQTVSSMPLYYSLKYLFGKSDKFKLFAKGAFGMQFAWFKREGVGIDISDNDMGFYIGPGAGFMFSLTQKIFINGEYEVAYASNAYYRDGWINSVMGGIGIRF